MVSVLRMKVGDRVIALVPVHLDHDAEEGADPRHYARASVAEDCSTRNASATSAASPARGA